MLDEAINRTAKFHLNTRNTIQIKNCDSKRKPDGSIREYIITPYQMAAKEGKYYLICNYDKYDDISNYRIDRIRNIKILEEKGKPFQNLKWSGHQNLDLAEYMKEHIYMYSSENVRVKFRIVKPMITDVIDLFGKEVTFRMKMRRMFPFRQDKRKGYAAVREEFRSGCGNFAAERLRNELKQELEKAAAVYRRKMKMKKETAINFMLFSLMEVTLNDKEKGSRWEKISILKKLS